MSLLIIDGVDQSNRHNATTGKQGGAPGVYEHSDQPINITDSPAWNALYVNGDEASLHQRRDGDFSPVDDHFDGSSLSSYWTGWAGTPFVTPPVVSFDNASQLRVGGFTAASDRAFLYVAGTLSSSDLYAAVGLISNTTNHAAGVRLDDGTDNNYFEVVLKSIQVYPSQWTVEYRYRTGGGAINTQAGSTLILPLPYIVRMQVLGTKWTNWRAQSILHSMWSIGGLMYQATPGIINLTWTPTRFGLVFDQGGVATAPWHRMAVDYFRC